MGLVTPLRASAREIVTRYLDGTGVKKVAAELGISPGGVSDHLNAVEKLADCAILRRKATLAPDEVKGLTVAPAERALPPGGEKTAKEHALAILDATTARTWKRDAARVRELVAGW